MLGLLVSTAVYFVASYCIKRWLDDMGIAQSMTRSVTIFSAAVILAYAAAAVLDWFST